MRLRRIALLTLAAAPFGCKDDEPKKLFDEEGVWSLVAYDLGDGLMDIPAMTRKDSFLLKFEPDENVVTAAACGTVDAGMVTSEDSPANSVCRLNPGMTGWACQCFAYAYRGDQMEWRGFAAGSPPPHFKFMEEMDSADAGGSSSGGGGGGDSYIMLSTNATKAGVYAFTPLPMGVFHSDGQVNRFEFQRRTVSIFDGPVSDMNAPLTDTNLACQPCVP